MRTILVLLIIIPLAARPQFKRSATELAKENIRDYLTGKIFKNCTYQPVSYGELTARRQDNGEIAWFLQHAFVITGMELHNLKKIPVTHQYKFLFFFDRKMRVIASERF